MCDETRMVLHDIPLRPDVLIRMNLPVHLTHEDAERLCGVIRALAFPPAGQGSDGAGETEEGTDG